MEFKDLESLLKVIGDLKIDELEIENGDLKIKVKKNKEFNENLSNLIANQMVNNLGTAINQGMVNENLNGTFNKNLNQEIVNMNLANQGIKENLTNQGKANEKGNNLTKAEEVDNYIEVTSPLVGTYYSSPSPDSKPFVEVGQRVKKGETLCIIEAMKLMNEILCEVDGEVKEILLQKGEIVDFGKPIMRIKPL